MTLALHCDECGATRQLYHGDKDLPGPTWVTMHFFTGRARRDFCSHACLVERAKRIAGLCAISLIEEEARPCPRCYGRGYRYREDLYRYCPCECRAE